MTQQQTPDVGFSRNPYTLPADQQGWRGLSVKGNRKRKWFTMVENQQVLVTALLLLPGEASVQHSHETGELSIAYNDKMRPIVTWHPAGEVHAGAPSPAAGLKAPSLEELTSITGNAALAAVIDGLVDENRRLRSELEEMRKRDIEPRIIIDVLFPPFKTTIQDDSYPGPVTITGQWYD